LRPPHFSSSKSSSTIVGARLSSGVAEEGASESIAVADEGANDCPEAKGAAARDANRAKVQIFMVLGRL
jgi:hypothetical protein